MTWKELLHQEEWHQDKNSDQVLLGFATGPVFCDPQGRCSYASMASTVRDRQSLNTIPRALIQWGFCVVSFGGHDRMKALITMTFSYLHGN